MNKKSTKLNSGAAMLIAVIFFLMIAVALLVGFSTPVTREFRIASANANSKQAYFLAESGIEDAIYRLKSGMDIGSTETISLNGSSATTTITNSGLNDREIESLGDVNNGERRLQATIRAGVGTSFNYGIQAGKGGFTMSNGSGVNGNVYANGNITGSGFITGSAYAANSSALNADQSNGSGVPAYNLTFGSTNGTQDFAQSFVLATTDPINKARFYIRKSGSPSSRTVRIVSNSGSSPSTTTIATGTLNSAQVTSTYGWVEVAFTTTPVLNAGVTYWLVIDGSTSSSNYYTIGADTGYAGGMGKVGQQSGTWNNTTPSGLDGFFEVYLGGVNSTIDGITIGAAGVGNAHAHTVIDSTIAGSLYCQSGSGNNKACNTSLPDPSPTTMPISDANIAQWKSEAEEGGTISGSYSPVGPASTLGPKKISGNLTVENNQTITIDGTVWVTGNITIDNNVAINLNSSYGAGSGVIVADGRVVLGNNVSFSGSGTSGSYLMIVTTSDCPISSSCSGQPAIAVENNVGAVILNAQNGSIDFSNNAGAKEATAYLINLSNNAVITYESGLANVNFVSGPGGGWTIDEWKEIE